MSVVGMAKLEAAANSFDAKGVSLDEIKPLEPFGIPVLAFHDPDNIQAALTAPLAREANKIRDYVLRRSSR
jgi:hypothetical protein